MKFLKNLFSILLVVMMLSGLIPAEAFASEEARSNDPESSYSEIGVAEEYSSFYELELNEINDFDFGFEFTEQDPVATSLKQLRQRESNIGGVAGAPPKGGAAKPKPKTVKYATNAEAKKAAEKLGYTKVSGELHGNSIFKHNKKNLYISADKDNHIVGGTWKMASSIKNLGSKKTRMGTYDHNLKRVGD